LTFHASRTDQQEKTSGRSRKRTPNIQPHKKGFDKLWITSRKRNFLNPATFLSRLCSFIKLKQFMRSQFLTLASALTFSVAVFSCAESGTSNNTTTDSTTTNTTTAAAGNEAPAPAAENGVMVGGAMMVPSKNIVENAAASSEHTTLVAAVKAAGLDGTLSGAGPFTVFAPSNAAFEKLPAGTVDNLLKPQSKNDLTKVLTYHVVSGALRSTDLQDGQKLKTVQGQELTVSMRDGKVMINGANVTTADVISSNGVTHVVDGVILPK
jgi:uncharacterized surface protein with fasciclin (FAS1) repeats